MTIANNIPVSAQLNSAAQARLGDFGLSFKRIEKDFVPLSIEDLIAQCQETMQGLDTQLRVKMNDQKARNSTLSGLGAMSAAIAKYPGPLAADADEATVQKHTADTAAATAELQKAIAEHPELATLGNELVTKCQDGVSDADQKACGTLIDGESDKLRSDNETSMIEIQSIVSKRGQALQMTSNIVNSINESAKGVIQKIG